MLAAFNNDQSRAQCSVGASPLRIAFYGFAQRNAGSVSSAGYVLLEELLNRGHQVDFFGKRSFAYPGDLESRPNFRLINTEGKLEHCFDYFTTRGSDWSRMVASTLTTRQTNLNVSRAMKAEHARCAYDVCWYHGVWAFTKIQGLRSISWVQGPPETDGRSVIRHAAQFKKVEGFISYASIRLFVAYRESIGRPHFDYSDIVIGGSEWSAKRLREFVSPTTPVRVLPYPIDINAFLPNSSQRQPRPPIVLWAGRSVPRKRLDLFLGACEKLIAGGRELDVRLVGQFSFAPGYQKLIEAFAYPKSLTYCREIPRPQLPDLYRKASVLVQPSEEENFGSSVAEALACGTPVIVGPSNGTGDYIGDGGIRFDHYTVDSVAQAIANVLDGLAADPSGWATRTRETAVQAFSVGPIVDQLELILRAPKVEMAVYETRFAGQD